MPAKSPAAIAKQRAYRVAWAKANPEKVREANARWRAKNPDKTRAALRRRHAVMPVQKRLLRSAQQRARQTGVVCTITAEDIVVPMLCPVLRIPLLPGAGKQGAGSPSLDRIDPARGYVPGNVQVISYRANTMKNAATREELLAFAAWAVKTYSA